MRKIEITVGGAREAVLAEEIMGKLLAILERNKGEDFTMTQFCLPDPKPEEIQARKDILIPSFLLKGRCCND